MALGANLELAQIASFVGLHGLTLATIAIFAAPATLATETRGRWAAESAGARRIAPRSSASAHGALARRQAPTVPQVKLRIMQPNIAQGRDFSPQNGEAIVQAISRPLRPRDLADHLKRRRRHASDLA